MNTSYITQAGAASDFWGGKKKLKHHLFKRKRRKFNRPEKVKVLEWPPVTEAQTQSPIFCSYNTKMVRHYANTASLKENDKNHLPKHKAVKNSTVWPVMDGAGMFLHE